MQTNQKQAFIFYICANENVNFPLKCLNLSPMFSFHRICAAKTNNINQIVMTISLFLHYISHILFTYCLLLYTVRLNMV